ncbi:MAG TPA: hypothetical protein VF359_07195 [Anaerolineales bacterium]
MGRLYQNSPGGACIKLLDKPSPESGTKHILPAVIFRAKILLAEHMDRVITPTNP